MSEPKLDAAVRWLRSIADYPGDFPNAAPHAAEAMGAIDRIAELERANAELRSAYRAAMRLLGDAADVLEKSEV